ncbi:MAG: hypothetical protein QOD24_281, partial [Solirubrobacteraceae bacterium]|nr:hypothetical protein [Solirubrobacteraceae bacterium]
AVTATASDDAGVTGVQFRLDGAPLGAEDTSAPYATTWDTTAATNGPHTLTAVARDAAANTTTSTTATTTVDNTTPPPPPPPPPPPGSDPAQVGQWGAVIGFPLVPVHITPMADGKVVMWDGFEFAPNSERLFDPQTLAFTSIPDGGRNLFCSVNVKLPDGRLMSAGGHSTGTAGTTELNLYNPSTRQWTSGPPMTRRRWYPSSTQLADGREFVISGDNNNLQIGQPFPLRDASDTVPEIYDPAANSWSSVPSAGRRIPWYPFMFLLPDGRLFDAGPDQTTRTLDLSTGTWSVVGTSPVEGHSAVMYRPGKIMKSGNYGDTSTPGRIATARAAAIDMNDPAPAWREIAPMNRPRTFHTLTALPDGTVMASGGTTESTGTDPAGAVKDPEIWDPVTDRWKLVAPSQRPRLYHSSATLLQDGRVLLAGGGRLYDMPIEPNGEIYSPPYLFKGPRPAITSAPTMALHGSTIALDTPDAASIASVSLVRMSSITHNVDQDQRFQFLAFSQRPGGLNVDIPANPNVVPPGVYQVFILNGQGVPSVAKVITIPVPGTDLTPPSSPSALTATGDAGRAQLSWTAATDNLGVVQYRIHRATTAGFAPSDANRIATVGATTSYTDSGVANGTTYRYRVVAVDAAGNASVPSNEATAVIPLDTSPPAVSLTAPANGATVSGSAVAVTATASDDVGVTGVQFRLDGAPLGAEDTTAPYATTWNATTATNGVHTLTAVARDAAANTTTSATVTTTVDNTTPPPPPPPPPAAGLVAAYGFDETAGTTAADASGQSNAGTINGPLRTTTGRFGSALSFDGVNDLVTVADAASLDLTTGMTLEAWVRPTTIAGWRTAILKERPGNLSYSLYAGGSPSAPSAHVFTTADLDATGTAALPVNTWSHLAATYDGTTLRIFVNGTQVATRAVSGAMTVSSGALQIGGNTVWGEWFAGMLDEIRIYDRALTATQVQADMTTPVAGGAPPPPPPPDTSPPAVSLTAPANGATVSGSAVALTATASDDVGVTGVQFRLDGAPLGAEDTSAPYATTWNTTTATNGTHTLTAVARDAAANTTTSTTVTTTVDNSTPPPPPPPPPPAAGLVAAYGFEEGLGASALDSSGQANTGILNGPTRTAAGKFGSALVFDGVNDWVTVPDAPALDLTTGMTLEAWIYPTTSSGWRTALMKERTGGLVYAIYAGQNVNRPGAYLRTGSDQSANGTAALPVNVWTHVASTYDGTTLRVFVNGTQVATRAVTGSLAASGDPLRFGGNAIWGEWFTGRLDEIRVYDAARTAAQIQADLARAVP